MWIAPRLNLLLKMFSNLFDIPEGKRLPAAFSFVGKNDQRGYSVWAPSIIYDETMGKYLMYFCTTSSFIKSSLCLATADSAAGPYTFEKILLSSGFSRETRSCKSLSFKFNSFVINCSKDILSYLLFILVN